TCDGIVLHKYDMLPYFDFDPQRVTDNAKGVNPNVRVFPVSSRTGEGMEPFVAWLTGKVEEKLGNR
ncbi:MAG: hydrogenase accessory protein HypB, partial [Clostridiales bacterium]|nr:hydrogenase accessory protein HypB [Clostridiales bacterium]